MSPIFILLLMIFCHIVDDYYLQGILASMKQKKWWHEHAPDPIYRYDYIVALIMHSMSWAFMIQLPIAIANSFNVGIKFAVAFIINAIIHGFVDNTKANRIHTKHYTFAINLIIDQTIHLIQIAVTFAIFIVGGII